MNIVGVNAGFGGMLDGMRQAGFVPIMTVEPQIVKRSYLDRNFKIVFDELPTFDKVPRHDVVCGSFLTEPPEDRVFSLVDVTKPRAVFFEFGHRADPQCSESNIVFSGYKCWIEKHDWSQWVPLSRKSTFFVAIRNDIKTCFDMFPFPESTNRNPSIKIDAKGYSKNEITLAQAMDMMGFSKGYDLEGLSPRRLLMESSPTVSAIIGAEIRDWITI